MCLQIDVPLAQYIVKYLVYTMPGRNILSDGFFDLIHFAGWQTHAVCVV